MIAVRALSAVGTKLASLLGPIALAAMVYLYVTGLQEKVAKAEEDTRAARQAIADRDDVIAELQTRAHIQEVAAARLEGQRAGIREAANNREILMRKLQDENAEIRAWAAAAVPDPVVRLRDHGPITGAAAYRQFLSESAGVHAAGNAGTE